MSPALIGYIAYFLISAFSWAQLGFSLKHKTLNLGIWPMVALVVGLGLLQTSFLYATVPLYIIVGNAASLTGTFLNLLRVSLFKPKTNPYVSGNLEKYAESMLKYD
jgi:hypothetical protein